MTLLEGGVCAPQGFKAAGVVAQIKNLRSTKKDCALIASDTVATCAGTFTTNKLKAPPASWTEGVCIRGTMQALFINSGNANACTGSRGMEDAKATAEKIAKGLGASIAEVGVLSTGVIGVPLPMDRIANGVDACIASLAPDGHLAAAEAIMTTDTIPKEYALEVALTPGTIRMGAIAKGSGMIAPNMATMISVITTDAAIDAALLHTTLKAVVNQTYNCICIDNDMSTSDAVIVMANGVSGVCIEENTPDYETFKAALLEISTHMAHALVRDGEGATKFIEINVTGAQNDMDAKAIARSIAHSQLCKTAFFGQDPNWGRIACAAGYADADFDAGYLSVSIEGLEVVHEGLPTVYDEADAAALMQLDDIHVDVCVGTDAGKATFWTCDLSHDYVTINADYRT